MAILPIPPWGFSGLRWVEGWAAAGLCWATLGCAERGGKRGELGCSLNREDAFFSLFSKNLFILFPNSFVYFKTHLKFQLPDILQIPHGLLKREVSCRLTLEI
jgi:hypothetical protein